jgi:hypothetical protein
MMAELSVIIPFVNEWPQAAFTIRNISEELDGRVDYEIIAIDNWCKEVEDQKRTRDRSSGMVQSMSRHNPWLKYFWYCDKLSHWQSKNFGVQNSTGKFLMFVDAHCVVSRDGIYRMFDLYRSSYKALDGTIHLPLTYHILESKRLIYKFAGSLEAGEFHYSFTGFRPAKAPYEVPCMSTCGMMMTRELYDQLGGWPKELGIYGGGENFINYTLAVLGKKKWIHPFGALYHHGEKRGYNWNATDYIRNRLLATYIFGGKKWLDVFTKHAKGRPEVLDRLNKEIIQTCSEHRALIEKQQVISIEEWLSKWTG